MTEKQVTTAVQRIFDEALETFHQKPTVNQVDRLPSTDDIPIKCKTKWLKINQVICIYADMRNSTGLNVRSNTEECAKIYKLFTGAITRIFHEFKSPYIDVQGDGVFGLFDGDQPHRALATAVTIRTFVDTVFLPKMKQRDPRADVGAHIGIDSDTVLVRKIGLESRNNRTDRQNEVWAGKPINMAAKLASFAKDDELLVSDRFKKLLKDERALKSCGCPNGKRSDLWKEINVRNNNEYNVLDFDQMYRHISIWCKTHGAEYCKELLKVDEI